MAEPGVVELLVGGDPVSGANPLPTSGGGGGGLTGAASAPMDTAGAAGNTTVVAGVAGQTIKVYGFYLSAAASVTLMLTDGAGGTDLSGPLRLATNGNITVSVNDAAPWFETTAGTDLVLNSSGAVAAGGALVYVQAA